MAKKPKAGGSEIKIEKVLVSGLKPHPKNYRKHPEDQIEHLTESIGEHGFYRNVVISKDGVILAGHGVVEAAKKMGLKEIPVVRLGVKSDDPRAIKVLVGDNEIGHLGGYRHRHPSTPSGFLRGHGRRLPLGGRSHYPRPGP